MTGVKGVVKKIIYKMDAILCRAFLNGIIKKGTYIRAHISFDDVIISKAAVWQKGSFLYELSRWQKEFCLKVHLYMFYQQDEQTASLGESWEQIKEKNIVTRIRGGHSVANCCTS